MVVAPAARRAIADTHAKQHNPKEQAEQLKMVNVLITNNARADKRELEKIKVCLPLVYHFNHQYVGLN